MVPVGDNVRRFLKRLEFSNEQIDAMTPQTSLNIDLGWNGDNLFDDLETLRDEFHVNLEDFNWKEYMKSEGELISNHILYRVMLYLQPYSAHKYAVEGIDPFRKLRPLTLEALDRAIATGRWTD